MMNKYHQKTISGVINSNIIAFVAIIISFVFSVRLYLKEKKKKLNAPETLTVSFSVKEQTLSSQRYSQLYHAS